MSDLVCCLDLGTTRLKAALFDQHGKTVVLASEVVPESCCPHPFHEFSARSHVEAAFRLVQTALEKGEVTPKRVAAVTVTNQRASTVPVGGDGEAVGAGLSWQDTRCAEVVSRLMRRFGGPRFEEITGLPPSFLWSLGRILWLREGGHHVGGEPGRFVLLPDYTLFRLGAPGFFCDVSNASVTGLLDLDTLEWSEEILNVAGIGREQLSTLVPSGAEVGKLGSEAATATGLLEGTPLISGGGDQQCAALGLGVVDQGDAALCLGTAGVISRPVGQRAAGSNKGFFCTAHAVPERFVVEGILNSFGSSLAWAAEVLGFASIQQMASEAAHSSPGGETVIFLPYLAGVGSPDHLGGVRGIFAGLELNCKRGDMAKAVFDGLALEVDRILAAMDPEGGVSTLRVSGGVSMLPLMSRTVATLTGRSLLVSPDVEASLIGAALLAWTGVGLYRSVTLASSDWDKMRDFSAVAPDSRDGLEAARRGYRRWVSAVRRRYTPTEGADDDETG